MRIPKGQISPIVFNIARRIEVAGGRSFLVGGAVVDLVRGATPKDWDIEVFNLSIDDLVKLLSDLAPNEVGKAFGILKLSKEKCGGVDIDINVPRRDNNTGVGHKDFSCVMDPRMTPREAARRRDFTINSLSVDLTAGVIIDPFGGMSDLSNGILRATDPERFVEDPLRGLRAMQLLPRKAKSVDPGTMTLIRGMADSFPHLPKERVKEEWKKLLMKAEKPSIGLEFLRDSGWIKWFPELEALIGCGQNPDWHPEGDVWIHSMEVVDSAAWVRDNKTLPDGWLTPFMFGTLLHDVGKPSTTVFPEMVESGDAPKEMLWRARGHDRAGMSPAKEFLERLGAGKKITERAVAIVGQHMQGWYLVDGEARTPAWKRLHNRLRLDVLGWMSRCDYCGRPTRHIWDPDIDHAVADRCWDHFDEFGEDPIKPLLMGRHLVAAGLRPGPKFGQILEAAYEAQLENEDLGIDELIMIGLDSTDLHAT